MKNYHIKIFTYYLNRLSEFLEKIKSCEDNYSSILEARLAEDMFPLFTQVQIAAGFSLRSCCPIANVEVVSFENGEISFSGLQSQIKQTVEFLQGLDIRDYDLSTGEISDMAGPVIITLQTSDFLHQFALPNFFFHVSMVYAIARANGIPATKGDFDGFHKYPAGFSFED